MNDSIESQGNLTHFIISPTQELPARLVRDPLSERQSRNFLATKWPFSISAATTLAPGWHIGSPSAQGNPPWPTVAAAGLTRSAKPK
jgi:hypothetical protein